MLVGVVLAVGAVMTILEVTDRTEPVLARVLSTAIIVTTEMPVILTQGSHTHYSSLQVGF